MQRNDKPLKVKLTISLDPDIEQGIRDLADEDDRSFSSYINKVLRDHLREKGSNKIDE